MSQWSLAPQADIEELFRLQAFLASARERPVCLNAARLTRPDTLLVQLLVAARRDWAARGLSFTLIETPDRVVEALSLLGLGPDLIGIEAR